MDLTGRLIVITGASSGLGRALAAELAIREGADVVIAARRRERLEELRGEISSRSEATVRVCEVDLSTADGPARLMERVAEIEAEIGKPAFGLINNAGITHYGPAGEMGAVDLRRIVDLNVAATLELTRLFIRRVQQNVSSAGAAILAITSLAARLPVPYQAAYAASKHAIESFCESIAPELDHAHRAGGPRVIVTTFAPGGIATEMIEESGLDERFSRDPAAARLLVPAERVAAQAIRAWKRERRRCVPGVGNRLAAAAGRFLPLRLVGRIAERLYRP